MRTYTGLIEFSTLRDRFEYLRLDGEVASVTFGSSRWLNQGLYTSREWRDVRHEVIYRDGGCDLGIDGFHIRSRATIHHINPVTEQQIIERDPMLLALDNLITTTHQTHNAIHFGDARQLPQEHVERFEGDTKEW